METRQIAEAFSGHRFREVYGHFADQVRWVLPGQPTIEGREAVVATCESSAAEFDGDGRLTTITSYTVELEQPPG
jgi:hypothetical protein